MPRYEYKCNTCKDEFELTSKIADMKKQVVCKKCGHNAKLVVSVGATFGEEPSWLNEEVRGVLQDEKAIKENPITSRSEYNSFLAKNDIVATA